VSGTLCGVMQFGALKNSLYPRSLLLMSAHFTKLAHANTVGISLIPTVFVQAKGAFLIKMALSVPQHVSSVKLILVTFTCATLEL
jgi:hypothetical protein